MKTEKDLRMEYQKDTGKEAILSAYGYRPYLAWLEEKILKRENYHIPFAPPAHSSWTTPPPPKGDMVD